jgi:hypothetical protein
MSVRPRIYVSGRMTGLPEFNFPAFHAAAEKLRAAGWEVENPAESFEGSQERPYKDYVAFDIAALKRCDAIYMLRGWDDDGARGSVWEHGIAMDRGLDVWLEAGCESVNYTPPPMHKGGPRADTTSKPTNPKDAIGSDKLPLHLWPDHVSALGSLAMLEGALKYGRANFRAIGVKASIYHDALKRHIAGWWEGEDADPDSGLPHLAHALACIAILVDAAAGGKLADDRAYPGGHRLAVDALTPHVKRLKEKYADRAPTHYTIASELV